MPIEPPYVKKLKDDLSGVLTWKATAAQQLADLGVVVRRLQRENNQYIQQDFGPDFVIQL